ncbi:MAG: ATP-dependent sacrificial sulfur transferase LarE [Desulfarculaceae bacterium]|jgi:uncharacterized protein
MPPLDFSDLALEKDWNRLLEVLAGLGSVCVAYSGGVDSTLLLAAAKQALGGKVRAVLCAGAFTPPWEEERARRLTDRLGVELVEKDCQDLADPAIAANDSQRCYHCKRRRLILLKDLARDMGLEQVIEGSQADDAHEDRPGAKAVRELGVLSPLAMAGLGKAQVRALSRALGLETADVPSSACLATRVPRGRKLDPETLERIARAESELRGFLPGQLRVRDHFPQAQLELDPEFIPQAAAEPLRSRICQALKKAGYQSLCLDLEGYRSGGANPL